MIITKPTSPVRVLSALTAGAAVDRSVRNLILQRLHGRLDEEYRSIYRNIVSVQG